MRARPAMLIIAALCFCDAMLWAQQLPDTGERFEVRKETYEYTSYDRRDPFRSLIKPPEEEKEKRGGTPLESFDLSQVKLVGIANDWERYYALVGLPDGKYYTVTRGMPMGIHNGSVHRITPDTVIVREYIRDYRGNLQTQDSVLRLRKEEGE